MRKNRLLRLVLAAAVFAAVSVLSFPPHADQSPRADWTNADETNPIYPPESHTPGLDGENGDGSGNGDGETEPDDESGPSGSGPDGGDAGEPSVRPPGDGDGDDASGGLLGLSLPAQAGLSLGLLALAFLALLPGRRMPADLR